MTMGFRPLAVFSEALVYGFAFAMGWVLALMAISAVMV